MLFLHTGSLFTMSETLKHIVCLLSRFLLSHYFIYLQCRPSRPFRLLMDKDGCGQPQQHSCDIYVIMSCKALIQKHEQQMITLTTVFWDHLVKAVAIDNLICMSAQWSR